ncbi:MAG: ATP-binding protein [Cyclobacteriaceae bacterium]
MNDSMAEVWLIEDSLADRVIIEEMLEGFCHIKTFVRVSDALSRVEGNGFSCLLLDLSLPDSTGLEGLTSIQAINPYLPVVILTGSNDMNLALQAINHGAEDYLIKNDLSPNLLKKTISFAIERSRLKRELLIAHEEMVYNKRRVEDLTYALTHDIRSPLSSLRISMNLIRELDIDHAEAERLLKVMQKSIGQMHATVEGFNEILQVQDRTKDIREWVNVVEMWNDIKKYYADHLYEIEVDFEENMNKQQVFFIPFILRSVLQNLLSNSIKYRREGVPLKVTITLAGKAGGSVLTFSDNGLGMDMARVATRLFEPFSRFHTDLKVDGTGVGLYIIKAMIESNGGDVVLDSKVNEGTTFTISLNEDNHHVMSKLGQA